MNDEYDVESEVDERIVRLEKVISSIVAASTGASTEDRAGMFEVFFANARDGDTDSAALAIYNAIDGTAVSFAELSRSLTKQMNESKRLVSGIAEEFQEKVSKIEESIKIVEDIGSQVNSDSKELAVELHTLISAIGLGLKIDKFPMKRYLPVQVYISSDAADTVANVSSALDFFATQMGCEAADEFPSESGSWFKKWFYKSTEILTEEEVIDRLRKGERALELAALQSQQAKIDKSQSEAASLLIQSLASTPRAVCQIGSILIVKVTDQSGDSQIFTRSLTPREMIYIEKNQHLLKSPDEILDALSSSSESLPSDARARLPNNELEPYDEAAI